MGNISSQIGHINHRPQDETWTHSFPKIQKVLPERDALQKLRPTTNGDILHAGGTLTRHEHQRFIHQDPEARLQRTYFPNQRNPLHKSGARYTQTMEYKSLQNGDPQENLKKFGSEPDLRAYEMQERDRRKKKYKAPSPPQPEMSLEFEEGLVRRPRLFKTQAETKKLYSSPVEKHRPSRLSLPEIANFHQELKAVTEKLRTKNDKLKTLDYNLHKKDDIKKKMNIEKSQNDELKTFYFGMNDYQNNVVNEFSNLDGMHIALSSESDISSEIEVDESTTGKEGIDLQLRPILPKKQLEIPSFSPVAAWRLLLAMDTDPTGSTITSEDIPIFLEERIEKNSRSPPPTLHLDPRSSNDKSGDSGISGDAGPEPGDERTLLMSRNPDHSWTPQQDLEDDSSLEDGLNESNYKHLNKPHIFSLSLPRDQCTSLQKIKQSMSGVFGNGRKEQELGQDQGDNWFLSKSAPNSLNNGFSSLEIRVGDEGGASGRLMYLPEFNNGQDHRHIRDSVRERSKSAERLIGNYRISTFSKSCENISRFEPAELQDPPRVPNVQTKKSKRFTFQSTVRQIERRRIAEKLSMEAEKKEKQRLRELEAMQRVEEEFQKKRAKEKANIRQQLRLFTIDDVGCVSLPPNIEQMRQEPDGAPGEKSFQKNPKSKANSESSDETKMKTQVTQVLSEYRHPHREYKEYTGRYLNEQNEGYAKTTVHPQVTYNMPKSKQGVGDVTSTNYRKEFVHGLKSTRYAGSNFSEESPKLYRNKYAPITRF